MHTNFFTIAVQVWFCFIGWFGVLFFGDLFVCGLGVSSNYNERLRCFTSYHDCTGQKVFHLCCFTGNETRIVILLFSYMNINCITDFFKLSKLSDKLYQKYIAKQSQMPYCLWHSQDATLIIMYYSILVQEHHGQVGNNAF